MKTFEHNTLTTGGSIIFLAFYFYRRSFHACCVNVGGGSNSGSICGVDKVMKCRWEYEGRI